MVINGMDLSFLDNVDIEENSVIKPIRFNENELYMLKFQKFKGLNFSSYVKMLITQDIQNHCNKEIKNITREDIEDIISDLLKEKDFKVNNINNEDNDKYVDELELLGIKKR